MLCGIEIHQRLSGSKLFCSCSPGESRQSGSVEFTRRLHAVRSELGELDSAVRLEAMRERHFHYQAQLSSSCLVEADEEPPHPMSQEALRAVLVVCHLLSSRPVDQVHVMRKNVIDGSNTSGFQRTAVIGMGGAIKTPSGSLGIQTVCIEEESAGISESRDSQANYLLDRLGIPLVEIATSPDLKSGREAQEAALAIGTMLRMTGLVTRGIGTIRQDINVSIPEGARVEIKGVQDLAMVGKTVELEVQRQQALLAISSEMKGRIGSGQAEQVFVDMTELFTETRSQMVGKMVKAGSRVIGMRLKGLSSFLGREVSPGRRFGTELADYARAAGLRGMIHSDEDLGKYGFSDDEIAEVRAALSVGAEDAFVMVAGEEKKARAALSEVACRAGFPGVPEETRRANADGTSSYMRPLPGKARLYPETDLPPILVTKEALAEAKKAAEAVAKGEEAAQKEMEGLNPELAVQLSSVRGLISGGAPGRHSTQSPELSAFMRATREGVDRTFSASVLTSILQSLKRERVQTLALDESRLLSFLLAYRDGMFPKSASASVLRAMCEEPSLGPKEAVKKAGAEKISGKALKELIAQEKLGLPGLMAKYRLRVDASEVQALLSKKK